MRTGPKMVRTWEMPPEPGAEIIAVRGTKHVIWVREAPGRLTSGLWKSGIRKPDGQNAGWLAAEEWLTWDNLIARYKTLTDATHELRDNSWVP